MPASVFSGRSFRQEHWEALSCSCPSTLWEVWPVPRYAFLCQVILASLQNYGYDFSLSAPTMRVKIVRAVSDPFKSIVFHVCPRQCCEGQATGTDFHLSRSGDRGVQCAPDTVPGSSFPASLRSVSPPPLHLPLPSLPFCLSSPLICLLFLSPSSLNISRELCLESYLHKTITKGARMTFLYGPGSIALTNEADLRENKLLVLY